MYPIHPIHPKNRAVLTASAARSVQSYDLFSTESEWVASVLTQLGGEYSERLAAMTHDILDACSEADKLLSDESLYIEHDVLTEQQWATIFAAADAFSCPTDAESAADIKRNLEAAIRSMLLEMPRTDLEILFIHLSTAVEQTVPDADMFHDLTTDELIDKTFALELAYTRNALHNYPAAVRAVLSQGKDKLSADKRKRLARAVTARMVTMPHYKAMLESGAITLEQLAVSAYTLVESRAMFSDAPATENAVDDDIMLALIFLMFAALLTLVVLHLSKYTITLTLGVSMGLLGVAAFLCALGFACSAVDLYNALFPAGIGETEPGFAVRHTAAKVATKGGNLLRNAKNSIAGNPAVPDKVMVEPPRVYAHDYVIV